VVQVAWHHYGRVHLLALLCCCTSQPMADNYALATDKQTGKQKDHIIMSA